MKPLIASLVLLLLALCRSSAHLSYKVVSNNVKSSTSMISVSTGSEKSKEVNEHLGKSAAGELNDQQKDQLLEKAGNLLFMLSLAEAQVGDKMPKFMTDALANGVLCDAKEPGYDAMLNAAMPALAGAKLAEMKADMAKLKKFAINCDKLSTPPTDDENCVCTDTDKSPLICMTLWFKRVSKDPEAKFTERTCRNQALKELKESGLKVLGPTYDLDDFDKKSGIKEIFASDVAGIDAITENSKDEATKFFCDALDSKVEEKVVALYAADGMYWFADALILTIAFGPAEKDLPTACKDPEFAANPYGKCVCKMDTGFSFCIYKVLAQIFQDAKYLDCDAKKFVKEKKPTALPQIAPKKKEGGGGGGGGGSTSSATASSLLMMPLVAAAALLA